MQPIARVAVDIGLAHLDRPFDYLVPADLHESVAPGCRVTVRFAGKQVTGFVLERVDETAHEGRLGRISKVVSSEVVLSAEVAQLVRSVADRYAGTFSDVVRLAVPPRHARTEKREVAPASSDPLPAASTGSWHDYQGGTEFVESLAAGGAPRACWTALPGPSREHAIAEAVLAAAHAGRGAIICVPDAKDVARLDAALAQVLGARRHVVLSANLGPGARYAAFLALARGHVKIVLGTRGAAFAPVHDLGLVVIWDDGDDLHAEQRAPYPHAREILLTRALQAGCGLLIGGHARTCEAQQLVESAWATHLGPSADRRRQGWARATVAGSAEHAPSRDQAAQSARLPHEAFQLVRKALADGPVLVQVPRLGYRTALACQCCRAPARCRHCQGPLSQPHADATPSCRWCGRLASSWRCPECSGSHLRAPVVGESRTAEELGRAFPQTLVRTSSGDAVLETIDDHSGIVVATPGAEPVAAGGYAAALLMDTWLLLSRPDLRTTEESVRRWLNAVALVRGADEGGRVVMMGDASLPAVQAIVRADPVGHALRELADRRQTRFPPAVRLATIEGPTSALSDMLDHDWPDPTDLLGPAPVEHRGSRADGSTDEPVSRLILRVPRRQGPALSRELQHLHAERSTRKASGLRIRVDPVALH